MNDNQMNREQLMDELTRLRQKNLELEQALRRQNSEPPVKSAMPFHEKEAAETANKKFDYAFSDLVDIPILDKLLDSFHKFTMISNAILDTNNNILSGIGWQDICQKFHRVGETTSCRCRKSDQYMSEHLNDGPYIGYRCMNGLMDYCTPIIIEGQHLATIFLGQILHEPPDEDFFRQQAKENSFDETAYMAALKKVPVIPQKRIESIMLFYSQLGELLASIGLERKHQLQAADSAIKDREERLKMVLEASTDGFWDWDISTGEVNFSSRWSELLGLSPGEFIPHINSWENLLHPDDSEATLKSLSDHLEGKTDKFVSEYRMLSKNRGWLWFQVRGQVVLRDQDGSPLLMAGAFFDLGERKKAEAALIQSEEKFSKVFHSNPDLMSISTLKEGRYIDINAAFEEVAGYSRADAIGHTAEELGVWPDPSERQLLLQQIQEQRHIRGFDINFRNKAGEIRSVILSGEIIEIDEVPHLLSVIKDITSRKEMEEALRSSEERFSKAFNSAPIPMCISNLADARFIDMNDRYCEVLGFKREELLGCSSFDLDIWDNMADRILVGEQIRRGEPITDMEMRFRKKSGEVRLGLYSAEGLTINGELCLLSMLIDITDRKQLESEMNRLSQLNLVGEMAASIGHEIRNPMTTVRGFLQILRDNEVYAKEVEYFDLMIEEMDRANLIISEFLSLAKNKMVRKMPENLNAIIRSLLPLVQANAMIVDQHIKLDLNPIPDLLLDSKEISQLILNLVNNALESMPAGGEATVRTYADENSVILSVQDQGHGIEKDLIEKLGTPFFTTKEQGVGLGLATCYRIASRHNAKIDLISSFTGTTFWVRFPLETAVPIQV